jgi:arylformamidase
MSDFDPFRISALVPDFEAVQAWFKVASNAARARLRSQLDIAYGPGERETLDLFFPAALEGPLPVHLFVHGGYWRANVKEDYAFVAETVTAAGAIAAIIEYSLMPGARMAQIVDQVRRAAAFVQQTAPTFGGDPGAMSASGHSAGAHLASYLAAKAPHEAAFPPVTVKSLLLVSGIYDLRQIATSFLQPEIGLTPDEVATWSPFEAQQAPGVAVTVAVGHDETEPFRIQAQDLAFAAERRGVAIERVTLSGHNHVTIVRDMGVPGTVMSDLIAQSIAQSRR